MQQITDNLNTMEVTGKVDLTILKDLNVLRDFLIQLKHKWLENKSSDGYYFYQGLRNIELMLDKMQKRFETSQENHDNPKIAEDSLILFGKVDDLIQLTESDEITNETINKILSKTRDLRNVAADQNLIEPPEIDRELIDKENIRYNFNKIMKNLDIPVEETITVDEESENNS